MIKPELHYETYIIYRSHTLSCKSAVLQDFITKTSVYQAVGDVQGSFLNFIIMYLE